jgi:[phosphatase 2A protein]-leucine-carboxy methyltransferase
VLILDYYRQLIYLNVMIRSKLGKDLITPLYSLVSVDLRNLQELNKKLDECKIDRSIPTLFVAECVLVYMSVEHSASLLNHLSKTFDKCCFLNYEMVIEII